MTDEYAYKRVQTPYDICEPYLNQYVRYQLNII